MCRRDAAFYAVEVTTPATVRSGSAPPWLQDGAAALTVAVVLSAIITITQAGAGQPPDVLAYVFAAGFGAILLLRRSLPVPVLVLSVLGTFAYYTLELPTIGVALPVVAALFSAAEQGLARWAIGAGAVMFAVSLLFRLRDDPQPLGYLLGTDAVTNIALIAAAIALGYGVRARRLRAAQQEQIARLTAQQTRREAELRIRDERERISRELHDTVGHFLSVISLHAGVAGDAVGHDDAAVSQALRQVREQATESLTELRSMVRLLRTEAAEAGSPPTGADAAPGAGRQVRSLADVPVILGRARAAGLQIHSDLTIDPGALSSSVDTAAYRVIQESVTNVLRHAEATSLQVSARLDGGELRIVVADDGRGAAAGRSENGPVDDHRGVGIIGMTERVRLLGGVLTTRSSSEGFTVEARMPARLDP